MLYYILLDYNILYIFYICHIMYHIIYHISYIIYHISYIIFIINDFDGHDYPSWAANKAPAYMRPFTHITWLPSRRVGCSHGLVKKTSDSAAIWHYQINAVCYWPPPTLRYVCRCITKFGLHSQQQCVFPEKKKTFCNREKLCTNCNGKNLGWIVKTSVSNFCNRFFGCTVQKTPEL